MKLHTELFNGDSMSDDLTSKIIHIDSLPYLSIQVTFELATSDIAVALATSAALPAVTASGTGVGKTLTANATGTLTVDGTLSALNDRILVKNQVTGANNGIYKVTTAGAPGVAAVLTRATDFDQAAEMISGIVIGVSTGTANGGKQFQLTNTSAITVDTTALTFAAGEPVGTFGVEVSNDTANDRWVPLTLPTISEQPAGSANEFRIALKLPDMAARLTYDRTSGSGKVYAKAHAKASS